jgi:hypothetical protein
METYYCLAICIYRGGKTDVDKAEIRKFWQAYNLIKKCMQIVNYLPKFITFSWTTSLELYLINLEIYVIETIFRNTKFLP